MGVVRGGSLRAVRKERRCTISCCSSIGFSGLETEKKIGCETLRKMKDRIRAVHFGLCELLLLKQRPPYARQAARTSSRGNPLSDQQISDIYRAVTATRHDSFNETDSSEDNATYGGKEHMPPVITSWID